MKEKMNIRECIENADMVLIGIGEAFQEKFNELTVDNDKEKLLEQKKYLDQLGSDQYVEAYNQLHRIIENKNYFIVSLCNDDKILKSSLNPEKIVAPCGSYQTLQCENGCMNTLISISGDEKQEIDKCSECGGKLCFNLKEVPCYNEKGYLPMWEKYTKWLQGTLHRNVCVIELGVGFQYPSVIRWPFEKVAFFNQKANFFRIHETLYQLSDELKNKGTAIEANPVQFLLEMIMD